MPASVTYIEGRRIENLFKRYRQLAVDYWAAVEEIDYGGNAWMGGGNLPLHEETDRSIPLRQQIRTLLPEVQKAAAALNMNVTGVSYPAPMIGGPAIPVNYLAGVVDRRAGHHVLETQQILDVIDSCIGAADLARRHALGRLLKPWCWLVDVPALIVGWPFVVMRKAGVPDTIVESTGAHVIKAILTALLWLAAFVWAVYRTGLWVALQKALG
jgi:hypothetical protein